MSESTHIGLDNPVFSDRLRIPSFYIRNNTDIRLPGKRSRDELGERPSEKAVALAPIWKRSLSGPDSGSMARAKSRAVARTIRVSQPVRMLASTALAALTASEAEVMAPGTTIDTGVDIKRRVDDAVDLYMRYARRIRPPRGYTRLQIVLTGMAAAVFLLGVGVSIQSMLANRSNTAKVTALSNKSSNAQGGGNGAGGGSAPSTTKPSSAAVSNYTVAPDLPRYITIPKLNVYARVMQVGVKDDGSLAAPGNVYDAAWYTGSAKPGDKSGATLIDGHVSSWTTNGVFYGLKDLLPGNIVQIQRGDGRILKYKVVKSVRYPDNKVDMKAALRSAVPGKAGLNLITCTGQVKPGTSEFDQRIVVFTELI